MNDVYFACYHCKLLMGAGHRWAYWTLVKPGVVEYGKKVSVDAVLASEEYWVQSDEPHARWLRELLPQVREFLDEHREHLILFGDTEALPGTYPGFDWLTVGPVPDLTPRYYAEVLGLRTWKAVCDHVRDSSEAPWWWECRLDDLHKEAEKAFEEIVEEIGES